MNLFRILILFVLFPLTISRADDLYLKAARSGVELGSSDLQGSDPAISKADLRKYVTTLCLPEFEGRGTGDPGERMATAYFAEFLQGINLQPAGDKGSYFQEFEFRAGMVLRGENSLTVVNGEKKEKLQPGKKYQPLSICSPGKVDADVVFGGFGIEHKDYTSFNAINVKDKWLLVLRGSPADNDELKRFAPLVEKAKLAKKKGAAGILFIKAANPETGPELIPPSISVGGTESILPAMTLSDDFAVSLFPEINNKDELQALLKYYATGEKIDGYDLPIRISSEIGIEVKIDNGRNVLGRLVVGDSPSEQAIMIGGHIDHLGYGNRGSTRAKGDAAKQIHPGADDNASGISAIMELAQYFSSLKEKGELKLDRDIIFAGWSGEEVGLWGSRHYMKEARKVNNKIVYPGIAAYINLDMIGRASAKGLTIRGTDSSKAWKSILDSLQVDEGLEIKRIPSPYIPSDSSPVYLAGIPILALSTDLHDDYHTPGDTVDKIDFDGLEQITNYLKDMLTALSNREDAPDYVQVPRRKPQPQPKVRVGIRMEDAEGGGIRITEISDKSPAEKAGLQVDDVITDLNGKKVNKVADLFDVLRGLKANTEYPVAIKRGEEPVKLQIKPEPR